MEKRGLDAVLAPHAQCPSRRPPGPPSAGARHGPGAHFAQDLRGPQAGITQRAGPGGEQTQVRRCRITSGAPATAVDDVAEDPHAGRCDVLRHFGTDSAGRFGARTGITIGGPPPGRPGRVRPLARAIPGKPAVTAARPFAAPALLVAQPDDVGPGAGAGSVRRPFLVHRETVREPGRRLGSPGDGSNARSSIRRPDVPAPTTMRFPLTAACHRAISSSRRTRRPKPGEVGGGCLRAAPGALPARLAGAAAIRARRIVGGKRMVMERSSDRNSAARRAAVGTPEPAGARRCRASPGL